MDGLNSVGRRDALRALGALGVATLGACCQLRPFPSNDIGSGPLVISGSDEILRPARIGDYQRPRSVRYAIDAHAHFFNATDLNVGGFIAGPAAAEYASRYGALYGDFLKAMAPLVDELSVMAPTAKEEYCDLLVMSRQPQMLGAKRVEALRGEMARRRKKIAKEISDSMMSRGIWRRYVELRTREFKERGMKADDVLGRLSSEEIVLQQIDPVQRRAEYERTIRNVPKAQRRYTGDSGGVLEFVGHMLSSRWMNLRDYQWFYTSDSHAFGIDCAFGALVDFDYWLDCPPRSGRHDQIALHTLIAQMSGGYMLPMVAYNPWTDIKRDGESYRFVVDAVTQYGFIGIKIYPPMGFYPYGNGYLKRLTNLPEPDPQALNRALAHMFEFAASHGIPVMAHANDSFGRDAASGRYAGPDGWRELLLKMRADGLNATVDLGHFGGDVPEPPCSPSQCPNGNPAWPSQFAELMKGFPKARVYGDIAYWEEMRICPSPKCMTASKRLSDAASAYAGISGRIMYGSDWLLLSQESEWASYPAQIAQNIRGFDLGDLFWKNARDCFGLGPSGRQTARISRFFGWTPSSTPAWMKAT
jgi:predicted TIM-barrel fold metal-dependent hydrolase